MANSSIFDDLGWLRCLTCASHFNEHKPFVLLTCNHVGCLDCLQKMRVSGTRHLALCQFCRKIVALRSHIRPNMPPEIRALFMDAANYGTDDERDRVIKFQLRLKAIADETALNKRFVEECAWLRCHTCTIEFNENRNFMLIQCKHVICHDCAQKLHLSEGRIFCCFCKKVGNSLHIHHNMPLDVRVLFFKPSSWSNERNRARDFQYLLKTFAEKRMRAITFERQPINERLEIVVDTVVGSLHRAMSVGCQDFLTALGQSIPNNGNTNGLSQSPPDSSSAHLSQEETGRFE